MLNSKLVVQDVLEDPKSILFVLTAEEKKELLNHISISNYKKNEFVFKEGDKPSGFMMLVEGKVKIFKEGVGGREQIIRMAKPMGIIGYRALFSDQNHIATAVTLEESQICNISAEFILNQAIRNAEFALLMIRTLAKELGFSNARTVTLTQKHIRGRLAESLIFLKDIANLSNMTTSNAIRTLSTFASEKVIAIDGRKIKILDTKQLERISKLG